MVLFSKIAGTGYADAEQLAGATHATDEPAADNMVTLIDHTGALAGHYKPSSRGEVRSLGVRASLTPVLCRVARSASLMQ